MKQQTENFFLHQHLPENIYNKPSSLITARIFGFSFEIQVKVQEGKVSTPLGQLRTPNINEGSLATLVIRPESLILGTGRRGKIVEKRVFGGKNIAILDFGGLWKNVRLPIVGELPEVGKHIKICFNKELIFVFPSDID